MQRILILSMILKVHTRDCTLMKTVYKSSCCGMEYKCGTCESVKRAYTSECCEDDGYQYVLNSTIQCCTSKGSVFHRLKSHGREFEDIEVDFFKSLKPFHQEMFELPADAFALGQIAYNNGGAAQRVQDLLADEDFVYAIYSEKQGLHVLHDGWGAPDKQSLILLSAGNTSPEFAIILNFVVREGPHSAEARLAKGDNPLGLPLVTFDHGEGYDTQLLKIERCSGNVILHSSLEEIGADVNMGYPKKINTEWNPFNSATGEKNGQVRGRMTTTRGPLSQGYTEESKEFIYGHNSHAHSSGIFKMRKRDFGLEWYTGIDDTLDANTNENEIMLKGQMLLEKTESRPEILVVYSSPHLVGYENNVNSKQWERYKNGFWKDCRGHVMAFRDTGVGAERLWDFATGPDHLKAGDILTDKIFPPDSDFYRIYYPADNLQGKTISAGLRNVGDAMIPRMAGTHRIAFSPIVYDGWDYTSTFGMTLNLTHTEYTWQNSGVGYLHLQEGFVFDGAEWLVVYVDYACTSSFKVSDEGHSRFLKARLLSEPHYYKISSDNSVSVKVQYLIDVKFPLVRWLYKSGVGGYVLDADEAHNLNFYGMGSWQIPKYDHVKDRATFGTGNLYNMPFEEQIRGHRAILADKTLASGAPIGMGITGWNVPVEVGIYGDENENYYYGSYTEKVENANNREWIRQYEQGIPDIKSVASRLVYFKDESFPLIDKFPSNVIVEAKKHFANDGDPSIEDGIGDVIVNARNYIEEHIHLQQEIPSSPRKLRTLIDAFFTLDMTTGRLVNFHSGDPFDCHAGQREDGGLHSFERIAVTRGTNGDVASIVVDSESRKAAVTWQYPWVSRFTLDSGEVVCSNPMCTHGVDRWKAPGHLVFQSSAGFSHVYNTQFIDGDVHVYQQNMPDFVSADNNVLTNADGSPKFPGMSLEEVKKRLPDHRARHLVELEDGTIVYVAYPIGGGIFTSDLQNILIHVFNGTSTRTIILSSEDFDDLIGDRSYGDKRIGAVCNSLYKVGSNHILLKIEGEYIIINYNGEVIHRIEDGSQSTPIVLDGVQYSMRGTGAAPGIGINPPFGGVLDGRAYPQITIRTPAGV